jgi:hypothetical protein
MRNIQRGADYAPEQILKKYDAAQITSVVFNAINSLSRKK